MNKVRIVAICDRKLAFSIATLFLNLLETKKQETFYELNALVTSDFGDDNICILKEIESRYLNCCINIKIVDNRFEKIKNKTEYISNACAYKFCLAEMFPDYDKILYLDTDLLVFNDLTELFNIELNDNYIAGVFSIHHYLYCKKLPEMLQIDTALKYVNAGVLLFNLEKMRQDNIYEKCIKLIGSFDDSVDQHIYNKVCYPNIKLISPKYNVTKTSCPYYENGVAKIAFSYNEIEETKNPVIYHYTGKFKPWNMINIKYGAIWLRYYQKTPNSNINIFELDRRYLTNKFFNILGLKISQDKIKKIVSVIFNDYKELMILFLYLSYLYPLDII